MDFENLSGSEFEIFCAELLRVDGFQDVQITKASGDQGVDIVACKNGIRFAIQCKRYSKPVGSAAVRDVFAGKSHYDCDVAAVLTNSSFSKQAREYALKQGVLLWDRTELLRLIKQNNLFKQMRNTDNGPIYRNLLGVPINVTALFEDAGIKAGQSIDNNKIKFLIDRIRELTNTPIESENGSEPRKFAFDLINEFDLISIESVKNQNGCLASLLKAVFVFLFKFVAVACVAIGILYGLVLTFAEMIKA